ncbi:MAG TPA: DUF475 domain-containing protein, partial [Novosphingobium sp.]|nr:DUF475 domain-containing protein [Novosphingobium sp.]
VLVEALGNLLGAGDGGHGATVAVARSGLGAFLYLNVLDASFSLDGVIGAFALSNNMVIIALGLSIGAAFVRALTLILVERDVLGQLVFLEHGAFWAILALAGIMLSAPLVEVPESITGLVGAGLIAVAFWQSLRLRQRGGA